MKQELVEVNLHGVLGEHVGNKTWSLAIKSVGEAMNAIEVLSRRKLYRFLQESEKNGIKYNVMINGRDFLYEKDNPPTIDNPQSILNSELCAKTKNLKTIDIVPVIEGAGKDVMNALTIIVGVILIVIAPEFSPFVATALFVGGIGLIAAGVMNLLAQGPQLQNLQDKQKTSYLFNGPTNTVNEGGPIPIGYGRLYIGSMIISASYDIGYFDANDNYRIVKPIPPINSGAGFLGG
jgi:predicted phage tail protein